MKKMIRKKLFPIMGKMENGEKIFYYGMGIDLRDYFAVHCPISYDHFINSITDESMKGLNDDMLMQQYIDLQYKYADEIMKKVK